MIESIRETRLPNDLVILTDEMPGVRSATLGFFFRVGSRHEPVELGGMTHFIEHAVFKGSASRSARDIAEEQDRLGGNLDAFTTHEETGFVIKVVDSAIERAFELMSEMLLSPSFEPSDLKSEQKVIIEEMKMIDDSPEEYLGEIFSAKLFPDHPLGRSIAGTSRAVRSFGRERTLAYFTKVFTPANLVIAAAGNVDHNAVVRMAKKAGLDRSPATKTSKPKSSKPRLSAPFIVKRRPELEQAHMIVATPFVGATDPTRYAADLLSGILGGGTSSRLWQSVREDRGLAYSVGTSAAMYQDCGVFSIFAATSPEHVAEIVDIVTGELRGIKKDGVTANELDLAKSQARASILLGLEDSAMRATSIAQSEMTHGRQIHVEETLANLDAVTVRDLNVLAKKFFVTEKVAFGALGDLKTLKLNRESLAV